MTYKLTMTLLMALLFVVAAAPAAWAADEKCDWTAPSEVENTCKTRCAGHSNPEACKAACSQPVSYYKSWTQKECTMVNQGECAGELGHYQTQQSDPAAKVAYGFVIYYGCFGGKGSVGKPQL